RAAGKLNPRGPPRTRAAGELNRFNLFFLLRVQPSESLALRRFSRLRDQDKNARPSNKASPASLLVRPTFATDRRSDRFGPIPGRRTANPHAREAAPILPSVPWTRRKPPVPFSRRK